MYVVAVTGEEPLLDRKGVLRSEEWDQAYQQGWKECIDYLHFRGKLRSPLPGEGPLVRESFADSFAADTEIENPFERIVRGSFQEAARDSGLTRTPETPEEFFDTLEQEANEG